MNPIVVNATTIGDAWFQLLYNLDDKNYSRIYKIDRGSYSGQKRQEYLFTVVNIQHPELDPRIPIIPESMTIPPPTTPEYVEEYFRTYLLMPEKKSDDEDYTYGERIWSNDQVFKVISMLIKTPQTNHAVLRVTQPSDIDLGDPPCLLHIAYKVIDYKLYCFPYFRSWDLWGGFPCNLAGIQMLTDYLSLETRIESGPMIASSCGLHIYDHHEDVVRIRLGVGGTKS